MAVRLKSEEFRRERAAGWQELEALLARAESRGLRSLDDAQLYRLPALYRGALSSLSVARAISLDRGVVTYLESLAARAFVFVYGTKRDGAAAIGSFLRRRFPELVWRLRWLVAAALALLALATATGFALTAKDPDLYYGLVPEEVAQGRTPATPRDELAEPLGAEGGEAGALSAFASFLFSHNSRVGMTCFALGAAAGVPVVLLVFYNGVLLGAMAAIHQRAGLGLDFWAWVLPHGVTELLAVCLCAAAGFHLGGALLFPGRYGRWTSLALRGREAAAVVAGAVGMFLIAGLIEGFFRQLVGGLAPRLALAGLSAVAWALYFARGRAPAGEPEGGWRG